MHTGATIPISRRESDRLRAPGGLQLRMRDRVITIS